MFESVQNNEPIRKDAVPANQSRVPLQAEEIEAVITPKLIGNHNENVLAARLDGEEVEAVIAPKCYGCGANHNETFLE